MIKLSGVIAAPNDEDQESLFERVEELASTIPGLSEIEWRDQGLFTGRLKLKLPVGMMQSRIHGEVTRQDNGLAIRIQGNVTNVGGGFEAHVTLICEPTRYTYQLTADFSGWLASLGEGLLKPIMASKAHEFEQNFSAFVSSVS